MGILLSSDAAFPDW